jgi:hypothetical protein
MLQIEDPNIELEKRAGLLKKLNDEVFKVTFDYSKPKQIQNLENLETQNSQSKCVPSKLDEIFGRMMDGDLV